MTIDINLIRSLFEEYKIKDLELNRAKLLLKEARYSKYRICSICNKQFAHHQSLFAHLGHCKVKKLNLPLPPKLPRVGWRKGLHSPRKYAASLEEELSSRAHPKGCKLKLLLFRYNIFERKCYGCKLTEWQGRPIPLELEHINGNKYDNRRNNLT